MDIRRYFGSASRPSTSASTQSSSSSEEDSDTESLESTAPKKPCTTLSLPKEKHLKSRKYRKEWERDFC